MSLFPELVPTLVDILALLNSQVGWYLIFIWIMYFWTFPQKKSWNFWDSPVGSILLACQFSKRSGGLQFWMKGILACYFEGQIETEFDQTRMDE